MEVALRSLMMTERRSNESLRRERFDDQHYLSANCTSTVSNTGAPVPAWLFSNRQSEMILLRGLTQRRQYSVHTGDNAIHP